MPDRIESSDSTHALRVSMTGAGPNANAVCVTSTNGGDSALGVSGEEAGRGTVKVTHYKPSGTDDATAAAISVRLDRRDQAELTKAQGVFIDGNGTLGKLVHVLNNGQKFVVWPDGSLTIGGTVRLAAGPNGELLVNGRPVLLG